MPTTIRALVSQYNEGDLADTAVTNTLHFHHTALLPDEFLGWDDLATDICTLFRTYKIAILNRTNVRLYSLDDEKPRPVRGEATQESTGTLADSGPREVALCLSFYSERNLPRQRGRLYLGPWSAGTMDLRPPSGNVTQALALGDGLTDIGGVDIQWGVYSPTDSEFRQVSHYWVDNEWDTVRSRGLRGTARVTVASEG